MKDGICVKCGAKEVHVVDGNRTGIEIALGWASKTFVSLYVCAKCGYVESFVEDLADLPRIAERWRKVE
jgi:predicted nucleic-acid-binding Zn-ribbon protein